jgi:hypothetical protein
MLIKEITPPTDRKFQLTVNERELQAIYDALTAFPQYRSLTKTIADVFSRKT